MARPTEIREQVRAWLGAAWDPDLSLIEWRSRLAEAGWARPAWPREWFGRGLPSWADAVVAEELVAVRAPGVPEGVGMLLAAPTILEHSSDTVRQRFLGPTVTGEITWCQLFSEPGAGSDLAGLTTNAVLDGEQWVITGQKVWNTSAHHADYGLLLARSGWDAPKHRGITCFALPMNQSGVEVRPLRQMNGHTSFNEVFLDDAHVPVENVIGEVGGGWTVALTTLSHERRLAGHHARVPSPPHPGRAVREVQAEHAMASQPYTWYPQRGGRVDLLVEHARKVGRADDPVVRQEIARTLSMDNVSKWTAARAHAARKVGRPPGPEGSIGKLASSNIARAAAHTHALIAGAAGTLAYSGDALADTIAEILVSVPAISIAGGTDEVQHNIVGERILGLPREPDVSKNQPFRDVLRNGVPSGASAHRVASLQPSDPQGDHDAHA